MTFYFSYCKLLNQHILIIKCRLTDVRVVDVEYNGHEQEIYAYLTNRLPYSNFSQSTFTSFVQLMIVQMERVSVHNLKRVDFLCTTQKQSLVFKHTLNTRNKCSLHNRRL